MPIPGGEAASVTRIFRDAVMNAITGYDQEEDKRRSMEAGFDHHLVKPFDHNALISLLMQPSTPEVGAIL